MSDTLPHTLNLIYHGLKEKHDNVNLWKICLQQKKCQGLADNLKLLKHFYSTAH